MIIVLRINSLNRKRKEDNWWKNTDITDKILKSLASLKLPEYFEHDNKYKKIKDFDDLVNIIKSKKTKYPIYHLTDKKENETQKISLSFDKKELYIHYEINCNNPGELNQIRDSFIEMFYSIFNTTKKEFLIGTTGTIMFPDQINYPRIKPKRKIPFGNFQACMDFIDKNFYEDSRYSHLKPERWEHLFTAPMPAGCLREEHENLCILTWMKNLSNEEEIKQGCMHREEWFYKALCPPLVVGTNEYGDKSLGNVPPKSDNFFTGFNEYMYTGFKAIVLNRNNSIEPAAAQQIQDYLKKGKSDAGHELKRIVLILPVRESALLAHEQARKLGDVKACYVGEDNEIWDPFPDGLWREVELK